MDLKQFKNDILFQAIHHEERSDNFYELLKEASIIYRVIKKEPYEKDSSYMIFRRLVLKLHYYKNLIALCRDLKSQGYNLRWVVDTEDDYYESVFQNRITEATKAMKSLRPYILKYTQDWPHERKLIDINTPVLGRYLKGWFYNPVYCNCGAGTTHRPDNTCGSCGKPFM